MNQRVITVTVNIDMDEKTLEDKVIYKKEMKFNFHPGTVYVIEVLPDIQTFRIVEDKTRFVQGWNDKDCG